MQQLRCEPILLCGRDRVLGLPGLDYFGSKR
jgi:hypothetical protein